MSSLIKKHETKTLKLSLRELGFFLFAIFIFVSMSPYYVWGWYQLSYVIFFFLACFFLIFRLSLVGVPSSSFLLFFLSLPLSFSYYLLSGSSISAAVAFSVSVSVFFLMTRKEIVDIFLKFRFVYALLIFPALIIWGVHHISGDFHLFSLGKVDSSIVPNQLKVESGQGYIKYPFTVVLDYMIYNPLYRFSGPFDEPGVVGTISALLLVAGRFDLGNKENKIVLVSGLLSLSLAFFVISFVYAVFTIFRSKSSLIYVLFFMVFGSIVLMFYDGGYFAERTIHRLLRFEDNRLTSDFKGIFESWFGGDLQVVLFGLSGFENTGSSSWLIVLVRSGVVGFCIFCALILMMVFRWSRRLSAEVLLFLFLFALSIYQRPDVLKPVFVLLLMFVVSNEPLSRKISKSLS